MSNSMYSVRNEADKYQDGLRSCPFCLSKKIKISLKFWTKYSKHINRAKAQCYCTSCHALGPRSVIKLDLEWEPIDPPNVVFDEVRSDWGLQEEE